jgi:hypothetical protein
LPSWSEEVAQATLFYNAIILELLRSRQHPEKLLHALELYQLVDRNTSGLNAYTLIGLETLLIEPGPGIAKRRAVETIQRLVISHQVPLCDYITCVRRRLEYWNELENADIALTAEEIVFVLNQPAAASMETFERVLNPLFAVLDSPDHMTVRKRTMQHMLSKDRQWLHRLLIENEAHASEQTLAAMFNNCYSAELRQQVVALAEDIKIGRQQVAGACRARQARDEQLTANLL